MSIGRIAKSLNEFLDTAPNVGPDTAAIARVLADELDRTNERLERLEHTLAAVEETLAP